LLAIENMSSYFKFASIFETTLVNTAPSKIIRDPAKIEFFSGPNSFRVPVQIASIMPARAMNTPIARDEILNLPADAKYVMITIRTKEPNPVISRKFCETVLDKAITDLSVLFGTALFAKLIYRGWLFEEEHFVMGGWLKRHETFDIPLNVESTLITLSVRWNKELDLAPRYSTMSHFFSKSILVPPSEEKLLYLWTMLEIYPMQNTTDIKPISDYLSHRIGRPPAEIKEKLGIGQIFGIRSDLVHNGIFAISISEIGEFFGKLEAICLEVLREMNGINYSGSLDKYFS
jgi:hypothetical protein